MIFQKGNCSSKVIQEESHLLLIEFKPKRRKKQKQ